MRKILQKLLSKLFIVSTIIIIQMIWWFFLFYTASVGSRVFEDLLYAAAILLSLYIANRQMKVYIKMSWIFLILSVPIVGIPCYFFFGRPELTSRTQKRMAKIVDAYAAFRPENALLNETLKKTDMDAYRQSRLITQNQKYPLYAEACTQYFKSGEEAFESILKDLEAAEKFIFMEYFIIGSGVMFDSMLAILKRKVKQGVTVRIIYDDFGSINAIPPHFIKEMESYGIEARRFNPYKPVLSVIMNDRDHRKILVVDGKVAHTGGYNIADEYINKKIRYGYWKDAGIRVEGECVNSFTTMFLEMWSYINKDNSVHDEYMNAHNTFSEGGDCGFVQPFCDSPLEHDNAGENLYVSIISRAKSYVYIFTPYLILGTELSQAMISAARSGVDIRLVIPKIPDKKLIYLQTKANIGPLIKAGVRIYLYTPGFIHSKCIVADDSTAIVGTCNLDFRSMYWNFEDFVYMYNTQCIGKIKEDALETFAVSEEVDEESTDDISLAGRLMQSILQLFAPLL